ncbi:innexin inx2-like [Amphibalanus amphitrite]|uniref:innexin inx2-like n=1 Tax=Amphibalanus amphitrite TaxID=1232801 RepID=UPI001C9110BC|nr:innexin inx2-like [Amphibalanus amphitrite]
MLEVLKPMSTHLKLSTKPRGEGSVFKLHYRATFVFIMGCCILVTATQYIGDPIECMPDKDSIPQKVIDTYCYITSTYTIPRYYDQKVGVGGVPHWGLGPELPEDEIIYHNYYIWVPYMLFIQAISFYIPHWVWKAVQTDKVYTVLMGLDSQSLDETEKKDKERLLVNYLELHLHTHNIWAAKYIFCEILSFVNVLVQISITNAFLGGEFSEYGPKVVRFLWADPEDRTDPMYAVFPRVTKCKFWKYGPSGTVQKHDALCVLALNIINEKIYVMLWFWLVILSILSGLALLYRLLTIFSSSTRARLLRQHGGVLGPNTETTRDTVDRLIPRFQYGDWYLMHSLGKSMGNLTFTDVLKALEKQLSRSSPDDDEKTLLHGKAFSSV